MANTFNLIYLSPHLFPKRNPDNNGIHITNQWHNHTCQTANSSHHHFIGQCPYQTKVSAFFITFSLFNYSTLLLAISPLKEKKIWVNVFFFVCIAFTNKRTESSFVIVNIVKKKPCATRIVLLLLQQNLSWRRRKSPNKKIPITKFLLLLFLLLQHHHLLLPLILNHWKGETERKRKSQSS